MTVANTRGAISPREFSGSGKLAPVIAGASFSGSLAVKCKYIAVSHIEKSGLEAFIRLGVITATANDFRLVPGTTHIFPVPDNALLSFATYGLGAGSTSILIHPLA